MLAIVGHIVSFLAVQTCLDAVLPDLESDDVIPDNLRWTIRANPQITAEFMDILGAPGWKLLKEYPKDNATVYWMRSKSYARDIYKLSMTLGFPLDFVLDALWLEEYLHTSWNKDLFVETKPLTFAGRDKLVLWQKVVPPVGSSFVYPRDYVMYTFLVDNFNDTTESSTSSGRTSLLIATNTTSRGIDYPETSGTVRGTLGICGMKLTEPRSTDGGKPRTKLDWLVNAEDHQPAFIPTALVRRVSMKVYLDTTRKLKKYLESGHVHS